MVYQECLESPLIPRTYPSNLYTIQFNTVLNDETFCTSSEIV